MSYIEIDMDQPTGGLVGVHLWTVKAVLHGYSKKGDSMLTVNFRCWAPGRTKEAELRDFIMLAGPGFAIGKPRMNALGVVNSGMIDITELVGRKVWLATHEEPNSFVGRDGKEVSTMQLRVDATKLTHKGYQPAAHVPDGCDAAAYEVQETPF